MFVSLLNFAWIFGSTFLLGFAVLHLLEKCAGKRLMSLDLILVEGLMTATVYAEMFSLFYHVSLLATLGLLGADILILIFLRKEMRVYLKQLKESRHFYSGMCGVILLLFAGLMIAGQTPGFYDTSLYHAQAIRWIEEYGCVKGLGNLHNRFAYNSSFLCLQALYSWASVLGRSLHGMNAYIAVVMAGYAVLSFRFFKEREETIADMLNLAILLYIGVSAGEMSSPNTDFFAMLLLLYVLSKWFRSVNLEEKGILCILAVFGVTVKLSIVMLVLIAVLPIYNLIKCKNWRFLISGLICGVLVVVPFLIRNVLISGYLVYPYAALDIFSVDWKMPSYTVTFDNHEIAAWGRSIRDVYQYEMKFTEWFPIWFQELEKKHQALVILNIGLAVFLGIYALKSRKKQESWIQIYMVALACLVMWLFSAPLFRYGRVFLYVLPAIALGSFLQNEKRTIKMVGYLVMSLCCFYTIFLLGAYLNRCEDVAVVWPKEYTNFEVKGCELNGICIYIGQKGDFAGYDPFPTIPYEKRINLIELRGDSLSGGFRIKAEYKEDKITTYGSIDE